ncbi:MAG: hypothetical protein LBH28_05050, partial [Oscillospiraceae bacterium]|nr:hypothetical protein [Oscillospiraceae bacterium]
MKKIGALFLCVFMLAALSGCRAEAAPGGGSEITDMYLNMDIDAQIKMMREAGVDESTIETMRTMQKMAKDGTLGDYLRGFGASEQEEKTVEQPPIGDWLYVFAGGVPYLSAMKLDVAEIEDPPDAKKALEIAKKYYDMCQPKIEFNLKFGFDRLVNWTPDFTGRESDPKKAVSLSAAAALTQRITD